MSGSTKLKGWHSAYALKMIRNRSRNPKLSTQNLWTTLGSRLMQYFAQQRIGEWPDYLINISIAISDFGGVLP